MPPESLLTSFPLLASPVAVAASTGRPATRACAK